MPDRPDRPRLSPRQLAAWCDDERQRVELLPWLQRPEALLRIMTVLVDQLAAEHGDDDLGRATDRFLEGIRDHLDTTALSAALASWARSPETRPGEDLRPSPGWDEGDEGDEQHVAEWFNEFESNLVDLPDTEDDEAGYDEAGWPPFRT